MAEQLSVFVDNKPGRLNAVTGILRDCRINIRAMTMADHREYGVAKLLVSDPRRAHRALVEQGFAAALKPVLAIAIDDHPGGLHELLEILAARQINVLDAYGFVVAPGQRAVWCMEVDSPIEAARLLAAHGLQVLADSELYQL
jgi:hypothetical protein